MARDSSPDLTLDDCPDASHDIPARQIKRRIIEALATDPIVAGVDVVLVLHAVGALDPDEHEVVELLQLSQSVMRATHAHRPPSLADRLSRLVPVEPDTRVWTRLLASLDADDSAN